MCSGDSLEVRIASPEERVIIETMGQKLSTSWEEMSTTVLLLGPDAAGKTTLLSCLAPSLALSYCPSCSAIETLQWRNVHFVCWDSYVNARLKTLFQPYCQKAKAVIFMVDSNHRERMEETREILEWILEWEELMGAVLLVLGNKQDLAGAMDYSELQEQLALRELRGRQWRLQLCSAISLDGVHEGFEWLFSVLARKLGVRLN